MKTLIIIGGFFHLAFFIFHVFFWKLFEWRTDLRSLSDINKAVMQILNLVLMSVFLLFAYLSFFHADEILGSSLGSAILAGIAGMWLLRAAEQIIFFGLRSGISIAFFAVFLIGSALYLIPLIG